MNKKDALELFRPMFRKMDNEPNLQLFGFHLFDQLPDYWFINPSSSSGKYHPKFANQEGGLVKHTLCACHYWLQLHRAFEKELQEKSLIIGLFAIIFHDALKYGNNLPHTTKTHDSDSANWIIEKFREYMKEKDESSNLPPFMLHDISECIRHHMGPWSTDGAPKTLLQQLVFIADYMASSQIMEMEVFNDLSDRS